MPFLLLEAMRGLPLPFGETASPWLHSRLSGIVNQPNTLGGLVAVSVAFCLCLSQRRWQRWPLLALSLLIAILARSGGGVAGLSLLAAGLVLKERRPRPASCWPFFWHSCCSPPPFPGCCGDHSCSTHPPGGYAPCGTGCILPIPRRNGCWATA